MLSGNLFLNVLSVYLSQNILRNVWNLQVLLQVSSIQLSQVGWHQGSSLRPVLDTDTPGVKPMTPVPNGCGLTIMLSSCTQLGALGAVTPKLGEWLQQIPHIYEATQWMS